MYIFSPNRHDEFTIQQFTYDDFTACIVFFSSNSNGDVRIEWLIWWFGQTLSFGFVPAKMVIRLIIEHATHVVI